jgi:4-amino-4-deoxy-L-arabinose transferase-like glycosyltransferase
MALPLSSDRAFWLLVTAHVSVWTLVSTAANGTAPLDIVEFAAVGREWQLGYAKHPPLLAWICAALHDLCGGWGDWPFYLLGQLCVAVAFWAVWRLARTVLDAPAALLAVLLLEATSYYTWMASGFNHNVLSLPCFALLTLCLHRALTRRRIGWWLGVGVSLGVGLWSKYVIGLLAIAAAAFVLVDGEARRSLRTGGPWLALLAAMLIILPHGLWLAAHGFPTLTYVGTRAASPMGALGRLLNPLAFAIGQLAFAGAALLVALPLLVGVARSGELSARQRFDRRFLSAVVLGPPALLMAMSVLFNLRLSSAWGLPLWSALGVLWLSLWRVRQTVPAYRRVAQLGVVLALLEVGIGLGDARLGPYVTGKGARALFPARELAAAVDAAWQSRTQQALPLIGGERWLATLVAYYGPSRPRVLSGGGLSYAEVDPGAFPGISVADFAARGGVLVWYVDQEGDALPPILARTFPSAELLPALSLDWYTSAAIAPVRIGLAIVPPPACG